MCLFQEQKNSAEKNTRIQADLTTRIEKLEKKPLFPIPELPEEMDFCGERVPLERGYVRERLITALLIELENSFNLRTVFLRTSRWFPFIEQQLKKASLPVDLKYLAVIESGLNQRAYSEARARGLWQLTNLIVRLYKKRADWWINEAYDPYSATDKILGRLATEVAIKFLKDLYMEFERWPCCLAGYNMNKDKYRKKLEEQGVEDFYEVRDIPWQTQRFAYRAIAIKLIMQNPEKYGYENWEAINQKSFKPWRVKKIEYTIEGRKGSKKSIMSIIEDLKENHPHLTYQKFVDYNSHILRSELPSGTYNIYIPEE